MLHFERHAVRQVYLMLGGRRLIIMSFHFEDIGTNTRQTTVKISE